MKTKILFWSLFNRWLPNQAKYERAGVVHPALTPRWINHRFKVWKATAYKSIMAQDMECSYAVGCRMAAKAITEPLFKSVGIPALHSNQETKDWLEDVLAGYDQVVVVRLDSDDMYDKVIAREVHGKADRADYFYWRVGYGISLQGLRVYKYDTIGVGPFFAHKYSVKDLLERGTMVESHHHLIHNKMPLRMTDGRFVVTVHGSNLSTRVNPKRFIYEIVGPKRGTVLRNFGLI